MTAAVCRRCKQPLACTLEPGEVGLHARCSHAATREAWRALDALAARNRREPTYRVVGVRKDGSREVLHHGASLKSAATSAGRWKLGLSAPKGYATFVVEPEE